MSFKRKLLFEKLIEMDVLAETHPLSAAEKSQRENLVADLEKQSLMEKICWWQKPRALWLREGDKNTKFFHRTANSNRRYNSISTLLINWEMSTDPALISANIIQFYENTLTQILEGLCWKG